MEEKAGWMSRRKDTTGFLPARWRREDMAEKRNQEKVEFSGTIRSVQPRSTVWRYLLDNRTHRMTGYNLFLSGTAEDTEKAFSVAISEKQMMRHRFHIGDEIRGTAWTKMYPKQEYADYYRAGSLKKESAASDVDEEAREPWIGEVPELSVYDWRGCRMLDRNCWKGSCFACKWACMANVTIEYNFGVTQKHRFESFCYGPKNCKRYKMGRAREVPYKDRDSLYDEGWLDDICTQNRGLED